MHLQASQILCGGLVQHAGDPSALVVLRLHQPTRQRARVAQRGVESLLDDVARRDVLGDADHVSDGARGAVNRERTVSNPAYRAVRACDAVLLVGRHACSRAHG